MATRIALNTVEDKIPSVSKLVKKTDYNTNVDTIEKKINDHNHQKYNTTPEFNKLTSENIAARLKLANYQAKLMLIVHSIKQIWIINEKMLYQIKMI